MFSEKGWNGSGIEPLGINMLNIFFDGRSLSTPPEEDRIFCNHDLYPHSCVNDLDTMLGEMVDMTIVKNPDLPTSWKSNVVGDMSSAELGDDCLHLYTKEELELKMDDAEGFWDDNSTDLEVGV